MKVRIPRAYNNLSQADKDRINKLSYDVAKEAAEEYSDKFIQTKIGDIVKCCIMLSVDVLINDFGWGVHKQANKPLKVQQFVEKYFEAAEHYGNKYDDAMLDLLQRHCQPLDLWEGSKNVDNSK